MKPQDKERINKMLFFAKDVNDLSKNITLDKLINDKSFQYSLLYPLGQIGEIAIKLNESEQCCGKRIDEIYPDIEWADWRGFRNRIFHDYGMIDFTLVFEMIEEAIPLLITELENIQDDTSK